MVESEHMREREESETADWGKKYGYHTKAASIYRYSITVD